MRVLGAVLAGGQARRFGSDKAAALLEGVALIDHAIAALEPQVETVVVCGRDHPGRLGLADRPEPGLGPLGGLCAALHHAAGAGFDGVLTTGCDMPAFPAALAAALIGEGAAILAGQPLAGYWPAALAARLDVHLAATQDRSLIAWARLAGARTVSLPELQLPNVNTPEDLARLAR